MSSETIGPGDVEGPALWWCERGSLVAVVEAPSAAVAAEVALRRFRQRRRLVLDPSVSVRPASARDVVLWEELRAQDEAGVEGARASGPVVDEMVEVPLFA